MQTLDWIIVIILNGGVLAVGFFLARGTDSSEEWFLGGRTLTWWAIGLSMFATNVDNADLVSLTGTSYREGLHILMVHTIGSFIGVIFAAFVLAPTIARAGQFTNAEYLETRYGVSTRVLSAVIQIQYRTSMLGLMIWSIYLLLTSLVALPSEAAWSFIVLLVILTAFYTSWGGLKSVVVTDAFQGIIMIVGMIIIFTAVWRAAGGWSGMEITLESIKLAESGRPASDLLHMGRFQGDSGRTSPWIIALGWIIIAAGYWTVNHSQIMRLLGARSYWDMKMAALFGVAISVPMMVCSASLGVFGHALFPNFEQPDQLYPHLANLYLGIGFKGLVVAAIVAAAISTFDSIGSSLSALFTRDIYARLISPKCSDDAHYLKVSRWATVAILTSGFVYLPFIRSKETMLLAFLTLIPVFVTPLFTIYLIGILTPAHRRSGMWGIVTGAAYGMLALWDRESAGADWLADWFTGRWVALPWSMVFTAIGALAATLVYGKWNGKEEPSSSEANAWLLKSREELTPLLDHPFTPGPLPFYLHPGLYATVLLNLTIAVIAMFFW
jgi:SSS family solute:Na+ symporter